MFLAGCLGGKKVELKGLNFLEIVKRKVLVGPKL